MSFLITGNLGYVGPIVAKLLKNKYPEKKIYGYDLGLFSHLIRGVNHNPEMYYEKQFIGDVRNFDENILRDIDHVIHLAAISNDPIGNKFEKITDEINFKASLDLLIKSVKMKVNSFTFASSCSVYGEGVSHPRTEKDEVNPLTAYAKSKINFERESKKIYLGETNVTCLRFGTACGFSPRVRLDLVLNDFVASGYITKNIQVLSDGSPFRPLIHVKDMAKSIDWSSSRNFNSEHQHLHINVGSKTCNYQIKDLAQKTALKIKDCKLQINTNSSPDRRSYKVDFSKYQKLAPNHQCDISLEYVVDELLEGLKKCHDLDSNFRNSSYMRLNCLNDLIERKKISKDLTINYEN